MTETVLETPRLCLRRITQADFPALCGILQDIQVMYAWEHAFTDEQVTEWIAKNLLRYQNEGFSYFAAILKETGELVGAIGPLLEEVNGEHPMGVAYLLAKRHWHKGYATEGARACVEYAFEKLGAQCVIAEIRPENENSVRVAQRLGMKPIGQFCKQYQNKSMPHTIYALYKKDKPTEMNCVSNAERMY